MIFPLIFMLILHKDVQALQVIGGNITVVQGSTAFFPCILKDTTEKLNQISWQKKTKKNPEKINFFTILPEGPEFFNVHGERFTSAANFNEKNGSFRLSNVTLMDQGTYTCIFTLFPSGNHQTEIPLNVLVPPVISVKSDIPTLGDKEVSLATCTASGSLPPAQVNWVFGNLNLKITTNSSVNDDGTTTTISTLWGVPTIELDHRSVQCVVTSEALSTQKSQPFTIQIHFPPTEVNVQEKSSVYLSVYRMAIQRYSTPGTDRIIYGLILLSKQMVHCCIFYA
uniref:Ig-like domain-containing protein n=1 Tax=Sphaeramia orbicularis TaxID=375764 RepID=A0A673AVE3_9TELE